MALIVRLLAVIVAYMLACVAASLVVVLGTRAVPWDALWSADAEAAVAWSAVAFGTWIIASAAMLPSLLIVVLAEGFAWRSSLVYAALGGVIALVLFSGLDAAAFLDEIGGDPARDYELFAAAGIAAGLVYWLLAGRNAGQGKPINAVRGRE